MPKCPKCHKEIKFIEEITVARKVSRVYSNKVELSSYNENILYRCPLCKSSLFNDRRDVIKFLRTKDSNYL